MIDLFNLFAATWPLAAVVLAIVMFMVLTPSFSESWFRMVIWELRLGRKTWSERFWRTIAGVLPKKLVLWAAIRLVAHGTQGKWGDTVVPEVRAMTVLKRWDEPNE